MSNPLKPGDRIDCKIEYGRIVSSYSSYDEIRTFEIVAVDDSGLYLFVPCYVFLKETVNAHEHRCSKLGINKKFLNEEIVHICEGQISNIKYILDGKSCCMCDEFFEYAIGNQEDGTLVCYACKQNPYFR